MSAPAIGAFGAGALGAGRYDGPATAATQVIGAGTSPTQIAPGGAMPWETFGDPDGPSTGVQPAVPQEDEPRRRWIMWTLIGVAAAAILGIILVLTLGGDEKELVEIPTLAGQAQAEAEAALVELGLRAKPVTEQSAEFPAGTVIRTDPGAGEEVETDFEVTLFVSSGPDALTVPKLDGMDQQQARNALAAAGFTGEITIATEDSPTIAEGLVIRSEPAVNETAAPDAPFTLYLSTGQVQLIDLKGKTEIEASEALTALGLQVKVVYKPTDAAEPGRVIEQDRFPGPVEQRATVTITVAEEPEPEEIAVPNLNGMTYEQAAEELGRLGLNARETQVPSDRQPGEVVGTNPGRGERVTEGSTVEVLVSKGPENNPGPGDQNGGGGNNG